MRACLIGSTLKHSFSKQIHEQLGTQYDLREVAPECLKDFVLSKEYDFYNVTIPYKEQIIPYLDVLDDSASNVGAVNTVANVNGKLVGYNTDIDGMQYLFESSGVNLEGKNVVILGTGGTSKTAQALMRKLKAGKVTVVGRRERWNYQNVYELCDAQILINTTPVGMYPKCDECLIDLSKFANLQFVADVIYNPLKTQLLLQAEKLNIPYSNGLVMLVHQAVRAEEIWQDKRFDGVTKGVLAKINDQFSNVVLVGMPSCGKSTIGKHVAKLLGKEFVDIDKQIEVAQGRTIPQIFAQDGEEYFRSVESEILSQYTSKNGLVISTGGGAILKEQNRNAMRQNSFVVWLTRDLNLLSKDNRPVSQKTDLNVLYAQREQFYRAVADCVVNNNKAILDVAKDIRDAYEKHIGY